MANDPYIYPGTNTLKNLHGIKDEAKLSKIEKNLASARMVEIIEKPYKGNFDYKALQSINKKLFGDIYEWAGKPRTIGMSKSESVLGGKSIDYPHPNHPQIHNNLDARARRSGPRI